MQPSRRQLLAGAAVTLAAACTRHRAARPVAVDPDVALTDAAVARELALIEAYEQALQENPALSAELSPYRDDHVAHLRALRPSSPVPSSSPSPVLLPHHQVAVKPALAAIETATASAHATATATASPALAQLLASMAASESSHAAVLT